MVAFGAALLAGCDENLSNSTSYRAYAPIPDDTLALMNTKGTSKNAPVLIRAFKKEAELEVWKQKADGHYVYVKTFPMCRWSGQLGPKVREGDRQVPEGFYTITPGSMNPNSAYYLSFNVGYPNAYDRAWGHTGGSIMVHGICSSAGCFSMTDKQIEEIYAIARESFAGGQRAIQMESFPFRMTAENLAKYRLDPNIAFWRELKRGSDYFEATKLEPPVGVCARHYVFGTPRSGERFDAESACPPLNQDAEVAAAVSEKAARDDAEIASLVAKGVKPVRTVYQDGGQNPTFANRFQDVSRPDALAAGPTDIALDDGPKAKPVSIQLAAAKAAAAKLAIAKTAAPQATTVVAATTAKPANADTTGTTVPGAFAAAPSAYAREEPKSAAKSFFDKVLGLGGLASSTPDPASAVEAAGPPAPAPAASSSQPATVPLPPQRQAVTGTPGPQASLRQDATAWSNMTGSTLDPNFVAYAPLKD